MKKFVFRLQKYLEVKYKDQEKAKVQLTSLNNEINKLNVGIDHIEVQEKKERISHANRCKTGTSGGELQLHSVYMHSLHKNKCDLNKKVAVLSKKSDEFKEVLVKLMKEINALEKMKDEKYDEFSKDLEKAASREIDEYVSYKTYSS